MGAIEGLAPIIDHNSRVLILGTMPGEESLRRLEYYGHPRNQFWPIFYSIYNAGSPASYQAKISFIREKGIAIWDVIKRCNRAGSSDAKISDVCLNDFNLLLAEYPGIKSVFFNGQKAYEIFQRQVKFENYGLTLKALPSTSPANATLSLEMKIREWAIIRTILPG